MNLFFEKLWLEVVSDLFYERASTDQLADFCVQVSEISPDWSEIMLGDMGLETGSRPSKTFAEQVSGWHPGIDTWLYLDRVVGLSQTGGYDGIVRNILDEDDAQAAGLTFTPYELRAMVRSGGRGTLFEEGHPWRIIGVPARWNLPVLYETPAWKENAQAIWIAELPLKMFVCAFWVGHHWQWGTNQFFFNSGFNLDGTSTQWGRDEHMVLTPGKQWRKTLKKKFRYSEQYIGGNSLVGAFRRLLPYAVSSIQSVKQRQVKYIRHAVPEEVWEEMIRLSDSGEYWRNSWDAEEQFEQMGSEEAIVWFTIYRDALYNLDLGMPEGDVPEPSGQMEMF